MTYGHDPDAAPPIDGTSPGPRSPGLDTDTAGSAHPVLEVPRGAGGTGPQAGLARLHCRGRPGFARTTGPAHRPALRRPPPGTRPHDDPRHPTLHAELGLTRRAITGPPPRRARRRHRARLLLRPQVPVRTARRTPPRAARRTVGRLPHGGRPGPPARLRPACRGVLQRDGHRVRTRLLRLALPGHGPSPVGSSRVRRSSAHRPHPVEMYDGREVTRLTQTTRLPATVAPVRAGHWYIDAARNHPRVRETGRTLIELERYTKSSWSGLAPWIGII